MNADPKQHLSRRHRRVVLAAMCVALATVVSAVSSLNVALPNIARDLRADQTQLQWIVDAYAVVFAGLLLLAGALGDRLGRRHVLLAGLGVFSAAAAAALLVDEPGALIAVRAAMGLGAAAIMPATLSIITNIFPPAERDRAVSIWAGVAGASALLGLVVSGALLDLFAWDSIFGFSSALGVIALVGAARVAPNSKLDRARLDIVGGALSAVGLSTLVYAIIEGPERGWTDPVTLTAFAISVVLVVGFVRWELRREQPLLDPRLFRLRGFGAGTASITAQFFAFFGFIFVILQYVQFVLGYSPLEAGLALAPIAVLMMRLSPHVPALVKRFGPARVGPIGLLLMAAGFAVLSAAGVDSSYALLLAGLVLLGAGAALATTPATTAIVSSLPQSKQGVASAVNDLAREVGGALGIAVLGSALTDRYHAGTADAVAQLPPELAHHAHDALPAALAIAERLGPKGAGLAAQAQAAFVDGLGLAMWIAAAGVAVAGGLVLWRAPARSSRRRGTSRLRRHPHEAGHCSTTAPQSPREVFGLLDALGNHELFHRPVPRRLAAVRAAQPGQLRARLARGAADRAARRAADPGR
jgi:EmrB/QacA subfamily drug resistance transporter